LGADPEPSGSRPPGSRGDTRIFPVPMDNGERNSLPTHRARESVTNCPRFRQTDKGWVFRRLRHVTADLCLLSGGGRQDKPLRFDRHPDRRMAWTPNGRELVLPRPPDVPTIVGGIPGVGWRPTRVCKVRSGDVSALAIALQHCNRLAQFASQHNANIWRVPTAAVGFIRVEPSGCRVHLHQDQPSIRRRR